MTTDVRINIDSTISCAADKNLAIEKIKSSYKHLLDLWDREKMTSCITYNDHDGIEINVASFNVDLDDEDDES